MGRCSSSSSDSHGGEKLSDAAAKLVAPGLTEKADVGASHFADVITTKVKSSIKGKGSDGFNTSFSACNLNMNLTHDREEPIHDSPDSEQFFQEGYCKASVDCHESATEFTTDVDCTSPCGREKSDDDEDGDNDDMLGDVFDFSEEG